MEYLSARSRIHYYQTSAAGLYNRARELREDGRFHGSERLFQQEAAKDAGIARQMLFAMLDGGYPPSYTGEIVSKDH